MVETDIFIDDEPTIENISAMVESDIRNKLGWKELEHFQANNRFRFIHPVTQRAKVRLDLVKIKKTSPRKFADRYATLSQKVSAYKSRIKKIKDPAKKQRAKKLLDDAEYEMSLIVKMM